MASVIMKTNKLLNIFKLIVTLPLILLAMVSTLALHYSILPYGLAFILFALFILLLLWLVQINYECDFKSNESLITVVLKTNILGMKKVLVKHNALGTLHKSTINQLPYKHQEIKTGTCVIITNDPDTNMPKCELSVSNKKNK